MGRNVQISKEKILKAGLEMLISDGYSSINITNLAKKTGCSTQPVAWHFGSMDRFRVELADYVDDYVSSKVRSDADDPLIRFIRTGDVYIDMAFDEPNLIRFMLMDSAGSRPFEGISYIFDDEKCGELARPFAEKLGISEEKVRLLLRSVIIYVQGLAVVVASGAASTDRETAHQMFRKAGVAGLEYLGIDEKTAAELFK